MRYVLRFFFDPGGPGRWSDDDRERFTAAARAVLARIRLELGDEFEVRDELK